MLLIMLSNISQNKNKGHGFIAPKEIDELDYVLGAIRSAPAEILQPSGQWDLFLPEDEFQRKNGIETNACVSYGTLNCIEILFRRKFGFEPNYSERYTAIVSDTDPYGGNTPNNVAEAIRKLGVIDDEILPFNEASSIDSFYSPIPMQERYLKIGKDFLRRYVFKHEWVFRDGSLSDKQDRLKEALRLSPVGASVVAWIRDGDYYVKPLNARDNHWITIYGYEENRFWKVFDHYDDTTKELVWDYDFGYAKRFHVEKLQIKQSFWEIVGEWIHNLLVNNFYAAI